MQIPTAAVLVGATMASATMTAQVIAAADVAYFALDRSRLVSLDGTVMGYAASVRHSQNQGATSLNAIRPNGEQAWEFSNAFIGVIQSSGPDLLSESGMDSWINDNFNGTWQYGQGGTVDRTFDMTPVYASWASNTGLMQQRFVSLTAGSITQFENIRAQGLTGTFTFNFDAPVSRFNTAVNVAGHGQANLSVEYTAFISNGMMQPYQIVDISGSSFTVNITSALQSTADLRVSQAVRYQWVSSTFNRNVFIENDTYFGITPIPAPGAIALLGFVGLARGRRRR
jgi:hypothetical protein